MAYEILMPQLSDSMEEGKLIAWKVKEGERVKKGDVIAEVESDKAIMEVQSFQEGVVDSLHVQEGEDVSVGTPIATINTASQSATPLEKTKPKPKKKEAPAPQAPVQDIPKQAPYHDSVPLVKGAASPKAKALASKHHLDIQALQKADKIPTPAHEEDIQSYHLQRYFTPKALHLLQTYHLDSTLFTTKKKHDTQDILDYINSHDIPLLKPIDSFQKALIAVVEQSAQKPTYHLSDHLDITLMQAHDNYTMTVWLIKLFATVMMKHPAFRSTLTEEHIMIAPHASISLAIANQERLYMPVFKDADLLTPSEIDRQLKTYKQQVKSASIAYGDLQGGTFGISNLGMLGIERFDAMINKEEAGIAAIGTTIDHAIMITLTLDHRLINGYQGALFMRDLKALACDAQFFKEA